MVYSFKVAVINNKFRKVDNCFMFSSFSVLVVPCMTNEMVNLRNYFILFHNSVFYPFFYAV